MHVEPSGWSIAAEERSSSTLTERQIAVIVDSVPGGGGNIEDVYPLAPLQQGMLFHRLASDSDTYVLSILFELQSRSSVKQLHDAIQWVIDRHSSLRAAVLWEGLPQALQVVYRAGQLQVEEIDLDEARDCEAQIAEMMRPDRCSMGIARAPLVRLQVLGDSRCERSFAILRVHHVICDHQSLQFIVEEVVARLRGQDASLPAPETLGSIVAQTIASGSPSEPEAFFQTKLADFDEPSAPFGILDLRDDATEIKEAKLSLDPGVARRLRAEAKRVGVSAARIFHAALAIVAARTSARDDVVFGTVLSIARHQGIGTGRTLGMAVNTLPLRVRVRDLDVEELVASVDRELEELRRFRTTALTTVQSCSGVVGTRPLFTVLFNYRRSAPGLVVEGDHECGVSVRARGEAWTNYPITLIVDDLGDECASIAQTDSRIDPDRILIYFHTAVHALVEALEQAPRTAALSLPVLPPAELRQLAAFNATQVTYPQQRLIHELFEAQVERTPHAAALVQDQCYLTYRQLNAAANRLAHHLRRLGVQPDCRVAICVERRPYLVVGLLAILKAGGAYVPLDTSYPAERLAFMVKDAAPVLVMIDDVGRRLLESAAGLIPCPWVDLQAHPQPWQGEPDVNLAATELGLASGHLAYVIYTSGSTGQPKGVMNEHRALINRLLWMQDAYALSADDVVLQKTPFSFDVSVWEFFWPLLAGAKLVLAKPDGHKEPSYLVGLITTEQVTTLHFVPSMLRVFLMAAGVERCTSLRRIICSGESLPGDSVESCQRRLPGATLYNLYGPTEAAIDVTAWQCPRDSSPANTPIGRPIANTQIHVLDQHRQLAPVGVAGEIYIGGVGVARGYLNREELTAERFVADPFSSAPHARMYKTGDQGRWRTDGTIEYLGRNDHQVKIRGFRIELGEIESRLVRHEQVKEAVVLAREDAPGEKRLVAYVVPDDPFNTPSVEHLRAHLLSALPDHMAPSAFVMIERMPLTPNGKLDRRALPAPELKADLSREYEAPQGDVEEALAGIWRTLLRVERIGRQDNFFELGGHSLLVMQAIARIESQWSIEVPVATMFEHPTLSEFANHVQELRSSLLLRRIAVGGAEIESLLDTVASMPESRVQELLQTMETRL